MIWLQRAAFVLLIDLWWALTLTAMYVFGPR